MAHHFEWGKEDQAPSEAEIITFPSWRHARLKKLAQPCDGYDGNQAKHAVRKEAVKVVKQRLDMGVPVPVADGQAFMRAAWAEIWAAYEARYQG